MGRYRFEEGIVHVSVTLKFNFYQLWTVCLMLRIEMFKPQTEIVSINGMVWYLSSNRYDIYRLRTSATVLNTQKSIYNNVEAQFNCYGLRRCLVHIHCLTPISNKTISFRIHGEFARLGVTQSRDVVSFKK